MVEKSADGDNWVRVYEVTICKAWDKQPITYSWAPLDRLPRSVFAVRSMVDPSWCLGTKPIPDPKEPDLISPKPIDYGTGLEVQRCKDTVPAQFWYIQDKTGHLVNAAGGTYITTVGGGLGGTKVLKDDGSVGPKAGDTLSIKKCIAKCKEDKVSGFAYSSNGDGFLRLSRKGWANMVIAAPVNAKKQIQAGYVKLGKCGEKGSTAASMGLCGNLAHAQWELAPMFQVEQRKQAISCSPYGHQNVEPLACHSSKEAQILCARDPKCVAYNWVDKTALGEHQDKVWLCWELHDIHLTTLKKPLDGWELGTRSGSAEDPYEKRRQALGAEEEHQALADAADAVE